MVAKINNMILEIIGLYRYNYLNQFHIRAMANLIKKSHVTLLPYLKNLEKDKILLVKEMGKNKVYSMNFENNQVREFLSLSEKKRTLDFLNKEFFIKKIYEEITNLDLNGCFVLFGSYASGLHTNESDVDLLHIGEIKESEKKKIKEFGKAYKKEIHLVSIAPKKFREQLLKQNSLIKEVIDNNIILNNHDIYINEIWRYYNEKQR